jgi:precorrin-6B methylase 2
VTGLLDKLVRGGDSRRTSRFHDENDVFVGWWELRHLPHVVWTTVARLAAGRLPAMPWWPYPAIERVARVLHGGAVVVEFGTGTSTLWLARRARRVYGIEGAPEWHRAMTARAASLGIRNVTFLLRDSTRYPDRGRASDAFNEGFASFDGIEEPLVDLVVVDGAARWRCVENALPRLRPGGWLYLDNSDADKDWCHYTRRGMAKEAQRVLVEAERRGEGVLERFRGLAPATPVASEGMLFHKR